MEKMDVMMKKNKMYLELSKSSHILCTVIYLSDNLEYPLKQKESDIIDKIKEFSDIYFVISSERSKKINLKKFTNLYKSNGYVISETFNESDSILYTLDYCKEFFPEYLGYFYISSDNLGDINEEITKGMINVGYSDIEKPVFSYSRLKTKDLGNIYIKKKKPWWKELFFSKSWKEEFSGMFSTFESLDYVMFFRTKTIIEITNYLNNKEDLVASIMYLESFIGWNFKVFLPSILEKLGDNNYILSLPIQNAKS